MTRAPSTTLISTTRTPTINRESRHDGRRSRFAGTRTSLTEPSPTSSRTGTRPAVPGIILTDRPDRPRVPGRAVDNLGPPVAACQTGCVPPRFYLLADVAELLNISAVQARALVTSGDLPAIQVGGRGQGRVEAPPLEGGIPRLFGGTPHPIEGRKSGAARGAP